VPSRSQRSVNLASRPSSAGAAGTAGGRAQELHHRAGQCEPVDEIAGAQPIGAEAADREQRAVEGERRDDGVHTRTIGQAGVDHRARFVDAAADRTHDALDDAQQVLVVLEDERTRLEAAFPFHVDLVEAVDQDVGDRRIGQQRLERAEAEELVEDVGDERFAFEQAERRRPRLGVEQRRDEAADLGLRLRAADTGQPVEVQPVEQRAVDALLALLVVRLTHVHAGAGSLGVRRHGGCSGQRRPPSRAKNPPPLALSRWAGPRPASSRAASSNAAARRDGVCRTSGSPLLSAWTAAR
jgi:hypothetical protein